LLHVWLTLPRWSLPQQCRSLAEPPPPPATKATQLSPSPAPPTTEDEPPQQEGPRHNTPAKDYRYYRQRSDFSPSSANLAFPLGEAAGIPLEALTVISQDPYPSPRDFGPTANRRPKTERSGAPKTKNTKEEPYTPKTNGLPSLAPNTQAPSSYPRCSPHDVTSKTSPPSRHMHRCMLNQKRPDHR
jgi:hypothetical protein